MIRSSEQLHSAFVTAFNFHDVEAIVALYETDAGADGRQRRREGRNTETARRQPSGGWLFVIDCPAVSQD